MAKNDAPPDSLSTDEAKLEVLAKRLLSMPPATRESQTSKTSRRPAVRKASEPESG